MYHYQITSSFQSCYNLMIILSVFILHGKDRKNNDTRQGKRQVFLFYHSLML